MDESPAIVAISTPPGRGAIGIVRLSGLKLDHVVDRLFRPRQSSRGGRGLKDRRFHVGEVLDGNGVSIDTGMLVWMCAPHSYTGEDVVELHCHGNPRILSAVVDAAIRAGARAAGPGEFTKRAFFNGKLDLVQAEAVAQVINADSERALLAARKLLAGELSERLETIHELILRSLSHLEAVINFPEDEVEVADMARVSEWLQDALARTHRLVEGYSCAARVRDGLRVAIFGRPNVGKSSLLNALTGRRRALVSPEPGTTRDIVESRLELGGMTMRFLDMAGVRGGTAGVEAEGIALAWQAVKSADLTLLVVDASARLDAEDAGIRTELDASGCAYLVVLNKCDLGVQCEWAEDGAHPRVSALLGTGLDGLKRRLAALVEEWDGGEGVMLMAQWQRDLLESVAGELAEGLQALRSGLSLDAVAFNLFEATKVLDGILGGDAREDVLEKVFSSFCIGK